MTLSDVFEEIPFWLVLEEKILALDSADFSDEKLEQTIQRIAEELDEAEYNVSGHGGNMLKLRWAVEKRCEAGEPLLKDLNAAVDALTLESASDPYAASSQLIDSLHATWPELKIAAQRADVVQIVEKTRLNLLIAKAKSMAGDARIRYLLEENVAHGTIISEMGISDKDLEKVLDAIKKEQAEKNRVMTLLEAVDGKGSQEKVRHLIDNNVAEALILELGGFERGDIDAVKKSMEEELKEKQRLAEEEAARKKAEAEGPSLEDIPSDQMIDLIDSIREIMEFSDEEKEIRVMCEQSAIPKALVDIAVSDPDKLDELEKNAEG